MSVWKETVITDSGMLPNPAHASRPSWDLRDCPGAAARTHMPPAFSSGAAAPAFPSAHQVPGEGQNRVSGRAWGRKAQGQLLRGCPQLWFWMNEPSPRTRYFTLGRNTFLEQSEDRGGEKEMFSRLFSTTQPSQCAFKVPWPEAAASDPKLVPLLWPPAAVTPPTVGAREESAWVAADGNLFLNILL